MYSSFEIIRICKSEALAIVSNLQSRQSRIRYFKTVKLTHDSKFKKALKTTNSSDFANRSSINTD